MQSRRRCCWKSSSAFAGAFEGLSSSTAESRSGVDLGLEEEQGGETTTAAAAAVEQVIHMIDAAARELGVDLGKKGGRPGCPGVG